MDILAAVVAWLWGGLDHGWVQLIVLIVGLFLIWNAVGKASAENKSEDVNAIEPKENDHRQELVKELEKVKNDLTIAEAELNITKAELTVVKTENDEYKRQVEDKEKELSQLQGEFLVFKREHGKWRIKECGRSSQSLNLSVAVHFIDPQDANLADRIYAPFWSGFPGTPWVDTRPIEQVPWFRNPSNKSRIVIFSAHDNAYGIMAAFNDCDLLEERVDKLDMSFAGGKIPDVDIAIVVFPRDRSEELTPRAITQAEYDALPSKDEKTLYFITDKHKD